MRRFLPILIGVLILYPFQSILSEACTSYSIVSDVIKLTSTLYMDQYNRVPNNRRAVLIDTAYTEEEKYESYNQTFYDVLDGSYFYQLIDDERCLVVIETRRYLEAQNDTFGVVLPCENEASIPTEMNVYANDYVSLVASLSKVYLRDVEYPLSVRLLDDDTRFSVDDNGVMSFTPNGDEEDSETFQYVISLDELCDTASFTIVYSKSVCPEPKTEETEQKVWLVVPSFFSPNGDGVNETLVIDSLENYSSYVIDIYNRYGELLHEYRNNYQPWDGEHDGQPLPSDTYWYYIYIYDIDRSFVGHVTIIR